ncbi:MAG: CRISPR system precrRNA processing endoribonuclease RAMP protein Cas6 [Bacillota bacterium]
MLPESEFRLGCFKFHLTAQTPVELPVFKGSLLRGAFGSMFRKAVCLKPREDCRGCLFAAKCAYAYLFESVSRSGGPAPWRVPYNPHPFVLEPPLEDKLKYEPGEGFTLGLVLIGEGISYLPYFIVVVEEMGRAGIGRNRGRFKLEYATAENLSAAEVIYAGRSRTLAESFPLVTPRELNAAFSGNGIRRIEVTFLTPARLQHAGRPAAALDFEIFLRALLRRYSWLSSLYCGSLPPLPYREMLASAGERVKVAGMCLAWEDRQRYSARQRALLKMGGLTGRVSFEGELAPYLPLIRLGEYLHVGKGTVFGLGKYRLDILDAT